MTPALRLQFTSVRTRLVDDEPLIGLKHTAKDSFGAAVSSDWIEMPLKDMKRLIQTLEKTLAELEQR